MARVPKHDAPTLAYYFLAMLIVGITTFSVGVGIFAAGDVFKSISRVLNEILWVLT